MKKSAYSSRNTLAINGGVPVRTTPLPWELPGSHYIGKEEAEAVNHVLESKSLFRYYGPDLQHMVDALEDAFKIYHRRKYALGVNSGTAALQVSLAALDIGPGDEVLVPGYMWISCIGAIINRGAIPRLVDIDETFCMSPEDLEKKISPNSKGILLVHMSGAMGNVYDILDIAKKHQLFLLEDCAQALGASSNGNKAGSIGDIAIYSFQLNKNITCGEGGMIVCNDDHLYSRAFAIHDLGYRRNEKGRLDLENPDYYLWGLGCRMSELQAAVALEQFKKVDIITGNMRDSKWRIRRELENIPNLKFRDIPYPDGDSGPFLITMFPDSSTCHQFTEALQAEGIKGQEGSLLCVPMTAWGLHWYYNIPSLVNKHPLSGSGYPWNAPENNFSLDYSYAKGALPCCDDLSERSSLLAIPSILTEDDERDIISAYKKVANHIL